MSIPISILRLSVSESDTILSSWTPTSSWYLSVVVFTGIAAVEHIKSGHGHVNYHAISVVVYTHPEVAWVGMPKHELILHLHTEFAHCAGEFFSTETAMTIDWFCSERRKETVSSRVRFDHTFTDTSNMMRSKTRTLTTPWPVLLRRSSRHVSSPVEYELLTPLHDTLTCTYFSRRTTQNASRYTTHTTSAINTFRSTYRSLQQPQLRPPALPFMRMPSPPFHLKNHAPRHAFIVPKLNRARSKPYPIASQLTS